jgi:hypothetical protein
MSYDIFLQGFIAAEASCLGGAQVRDVVALHVAGQRGDLSLDREFARAHE